VDSEVEGQGWCWEAGVDFGDFEVGGFGEVEGGEGGEFREVGGGFDIDARIVVVGRGGRIRGAAVGEEGRF